jgi:hypothetical protein
MGIFSRPSRDQAPASETERTDLPHPRVPLDGSTVRFNVRDLLQDPAAFANEERALHLVVLEGVARGQSIRLGTQPITVGRISPADLVLPDSRVSRSHCTIVAADDGVVVTDLGSTNGSLVDGLRVAGHAALRVGGTLQLGDHLLKLNLLSERELQAWHKMYPRDDTMMQTPQEAAEIRIEIDQSQRQLDVQQITNSPYFLGLAAELEGLRAQAEEPSR